MMDRRQAPSLVARFRRWLKHPFSTHLSESRALYEDLLRQATQNRSLEELLERLPERIREALALASFHLFILDQDRQGHQIYRLLDPDSPSMAFGASSAIVARMKRERRPSLFVGPDTTSATPEPWQMLATQPELDILNALSTQLLLPLEGRTRLIGFVSLSRPAHRAFTKSELNFLRDLGPQMGRGLETALFLRHLSRQAVEQDRASRELVLAREVQGALLPHHLPQLPGLDIAAFYQSADQVGGDYYDTFLTTSGSLAMVIADVSGKGVAAALVMAALRASVHALMLRSDPTHHSDPPHRSDPPLGSVLHHLNALLFQSSLANRYATLFLSVYNPSSQTLEYCNAGHNPPLLVRADGTVERLSRGGTVIGLFAQATYEAQNTTFQAGDTLLLYTDGITEAVDPSGREWSEDGLNAAILAALPARADRLVRQLRDDVTRFASGAAPVDDMTLLALTRTEAL